MKMKSMKRYMKTLKITAAKEESRGVFWVIDGDLLAFPFVPGSTSGVSKSGLTYNYKNLWPDIKPRGNNKNFDYYPRGRVEFNGQGKPIVYMNPNIDESLIPDIKVEFGLRSDTEIRYDNRQHYKCYLDEGYKPQK